MLPCSLFFVCSLPNEQKKNGDEPHGSASNRTSDSCSSIVIEVNISAGADHPPPSRYYLYFQSNRLPIFEAGKWIQKKKKWTWSSGGTFNAWCLNAKKSPLG
jgi:hypothetical protein